jgi:hypothetical protein
MLIDHNVHTHIEEKILPQCDIRRLANGSIDYTFYDQRAREGRGVAFRAFLKALARLTKSIRATRQPQAQRKLSVVHQSTETASSSNKSYAEAA